MATSFAKDGAFGAGGPGMDTAPGSFGVASSTPATSGASSSPSMSTNPTSAVGALSYAGGGDGGGGFLSQPLPSAPTPSSSSSGPISTYGGQGYNGPTTPGGVFFDEGGPVPDDAGQSQQQDPMSEALQRSLGSVDQTLQQMYQQFGLSSGGQNQTGGVQEAANMPTAPAGQSETGIPPQRPGPGTLPPTSNPFGKRADTGQQGGIQDDETQENA